MIIFKFTRKCTQRYGYDGERLPKFQIHKYIYNIILSEYVYGTEVPHSCKKTVGGGFEIENEIRMTFRYSAARCWGRGDSFCHWKFFLASFSKKNK